MKNGNPNILLIASIILVLIILASANVYLLIYLGPIVVILLLFYGSITLIGDYSKNLKEIKQLSSTTTNYQIKKGIQELLGVFRVIIAGMFIFLTYQISYSGDEQVYMLISPFIIIFILIVFFSIKKYIYSNYTNYYKQDKKTLKKLKYHNIIKNFQIGLVIFFICGCFSIIATGEDEVSFVFILTLIISFITYIITKAIINKKISELQR